MFEALNGNPMSYIEGSGYKFKAEHSVLEKAELSDLVLVIYDYMEYPQNQPCQNLIAYSKNGNRVWVAESPGNKTSAYYSFSSTSPLVVNSYCSNACSIDISSGKLLNTEFFK